MQETESVQQQHHCSCLTELQSPRCVWKVASCWTAHVSLQIWDIFRVRLQFDVKGAQRNAAAPVIDILFVIRMCLLPWELGADEIIPLQASHKCVSLAQMPILSSQSHWNPVLHTRTQTNTWASAPPLPPHFSQTFARFPPFLNLASAHHHGDLELALVVARQQWLEAFSLNYVHVSQVYVLCCKPSLLTAVLISVITKTWVSYKHCVYL